MTRFLMKWAATMAVNYINKDITTIKEGIIAHGVNCQRRMGSGVAKAIKEKWPIVYERYMETPKGRDMLGTAHIINVDVNLFVANCYTQEFYGNDGKRYASIEAIDAALQAVFAYAEIMELPIYLPKIGAGLGGLDWETEVAPIIEQMNTRFPGTDTYICEWP